MKVRLERFYKERYTLADLQAAKKVIQYEKEDECSAADMAEYAAREALKDTSDYLQEIIKAEAITAMNNRVYDAYGEGTKNIDVLIYALAKTSAGYMELSAYLTDIWQTGAIDYQDKMYVEVFKRQ